MKRPQPTDNEIKLLPNEIFFSRTDPRGIILSGNDVFVRISAYPREQLIGAPHNIIRHPDMPRCIFKLLWDRIEAGKVIAAYVKNLSANGDFYWVLAVAYPVQGGFLSIRIRPSSTLFHKVQHVYREVLKEETLRGMEAGADLLFRILKEAGFADYEGFMAIALQTELKANDEADTRPEGAIREDSFDSSPAGCILEKIQKTSQASTSTYRLLSSEVEAFQLANQVFQKKTHELIAGFERCRLTSFNMAVSATQAGSTASSLRVISKDFERQAAEIEKHIQNFSTVVDKLDKGIQKCTISLAALKTQVDVVDVFVQESLKKLLDGSASVETAFAPLEENQQSFLELSRSTQSASKAHLKELSDSLTDISSANTQIKKFMNGMELISQFAAVESSREPALQVIFSNHIREMQSFNQILKAATTEIRQSTTTLIRAVETLQNSISQSTEALSMIFELAFSLHERNQTHYPETKTAA